VTLSTSLPIPPHQPATQESGDPRYAWKLIVVTALPGCPDYRETFDLYVPPAGDASRSGQDNGTA
jgi:hypothetical protein